ncbi:MAG: tripartite tricarboxylate transporter permease [Treponema sp.]|nr:tripartite tricarboxylate transporter permease [Treponema sp.]
MDVIIQGFIYSFAPAHLALVILGAFIGILMGALPGISSAMGIVLLLPFTFAMDGITAIAFLIASMCGATFGGSITSILFATPGTPDSVMTVLDGYPMHKQGKGGKALGLAVSASVIGGLVSCVFMLFLSLPLSRAALQFASAEYAALAVLGIAAISGLGSSGSQIKTLISGCIGITLAMVGSDAVAGILRFDFGSMVLLTGIHFVPVMIGAFALSEVFSKATEKANKTQDMSVTKTVKVEFMKWAEFWRYKWVMLRASIIGMGIGILPGVGSTISSVLAYGDAVRSSKTPEKFGSGMSEGVIAPELATSASIGGSLIPTMTLGIPGGGTTAVILGAFVLHGMRPGPMLLTLQPTLLYIVFISMFIANVLLFVGGIYGVKLFAQVSRLPYYIQGSIIITLCFVGTFAQGNNLNNVWIMLVAGIFGYFMKKYGFSVAGLVLGIILGPLIEQSFRQMLIITGGSWSGVFFRPIAGPIFLAGFVLLLFPQIKALYGTFSGKKGKEAN